MKINSRNIKFALDKLNKATLDYFSRDNFSRIIVQEEPVFFNNTFYSTVTHEYYKIYSAQLSLLQTVLGEDYTLIYNKDTHLYHICDMNGNVIME